MVKFQLLTYFLLIIMLGTFEFHGKFPIGKLQILINIMIKELMKFQVLTSIMRMNDRKFYG